MTTFISYLLGIGITMVIIIVGVYLFSLLSGNRQIVHDIIENVNELIFIYDKDDQPCFTNLTKKNDTVQYFLQLIDTQINQAGLIPSAYKVCCGNEKNPIIYEGELNAFDLGNAWFSWKMSAVIQDGKYLGRIYVLNDITQYKELLYQLDNTNRELGKALEEQRRYVEDERRLEAVAESERIMQLVNSISKQYLAQLDEHIQAMETYVKRRDAEAVVQFDAENKQMIEITRETIGKVRATVQTLHTTER